MTKVLEENAETVLLNNRLDQLKADLPKKMDEVLTQSLLSGAPNDDKNTGGFAQYLENARRVMGISSETHEKVRDGFDASATPALEAALRELTGKQGITVEGANPVTTAATQIMGNAIPNYENLTINQKKLALVNVASGGGVPKELAAYGNTVTTAAAIEASRLGVTEQQLKEVVKKAHNFEESGAGDGTKNHGFDIAILKELGIERSTTTTKNGRQLKRFESGLMETARSILNIGSATSMPDSRAFQVVAAQRDVVNA